MQHRRLQKPWKLHIFAASPGPFHASSPCCLCWGRSLTTPWPLPVSSTRPQRALPRQPGATIKRTPRHWTRPLPSAHTNDSGRQSPPRARGKPSYTSRATSAIATPRTVSHSLVGEPPSVCYVLLVTAPGLKEEKVGWPTCYVLRNTVEPPPLKTP